MSLPHMLKVREVAEVLAVDESTVLALIRARSLSALKIGRRWRVHPADLERYIQANTCKAVPPPSPRAASAG